MYLISKTFLFFLALIFLGSCSPDMSTRETSLTQIALMESFEKASQFQQRIQQQVDKGSNHIAAIEDTSNQSRVLILELDTVFQIRYRKNMEDWILWSEKGLKFTRTIQQKIYDRQSKLKSSSWKESVADRISFEDEEAGFEKEVFKLETEIAKRAQNLMHLSNSMDTIPVPKKYSPPPPPVYIPPPVPEPAPDVPVADPDVSPS